MKPKYQISEEQVKELEKARIINKNKNVDKRLKVLLLRAEGVNSKEIAERTGFATSYIYELVSKYCRNGISTVVDNHYPGNRRNMSVEEERAFLETYRQRAEQGQIVDTKEIKAAYAAMVGHSIGNGQIYYVLHRHGWRKVMPRSKHPKKASDEAINASKKLKIP